MAECLTELGVDVLLTYKTDLRMDEVRRFVDILGEFADMNFET